MFFSFRFTLITSIIGLTLLATACDYDQLDEPTISDRCDVLQPTYDNGIEELLERTCAYDGCHVSGFASGNFTTYQGTVSFIEAIESRALFAADMPPSYAPEGKAKELTADEKELLKCWIASGFPEN